MLIKYSVENYKTFKEKATLSFIASNYDKETREESNVFSNKYFNLRILKSAAVYGANASGKTKLVDSMYFMRELILSSSKDSQKGDLIDVDPFQLSEDTSDKPSEFEVVFLYKNELYRYGFEVNKFRIISEWLYHRPKTKEIELFYRDEDHIEVHDRKFPKGAMLKREKLIRENALLLSVAAQFNDELSGNVLDWFQSVGIISGIREAGFKAFTMSQLMQKNKKQKILNLLKAADFGIEDVSVEKVEADSVPEDMPKELRKEIIADILEDKSIYMSDSSTTHSKYNSDFEMIDKITFSMDDDESHGTQKFFYLLGPVLDSLENGNPLFIDELDARLHPNLVEKIVLLFNSSEINNNNSQLVFNTHNTGLIRSKLLRRDQIYFIEKDRYGAAKLFSLSDFKTDQVKKNDNFEEHYLEGRYGAVPYLNSFEDEINRELRQINENEK